MDEAQPSGDGPDTALEFRRLLEQVARAGAETREARVTTRADLSEASSGDEKEKATASRREPTPARRSPDDDEEGRDLWATPQGPNDAPFRSMGWVGMGLTMDTSPSSPSNSFAQSAPIGSTSRGWRSSGAQAPEGQAQAEQAIGERRGWPPDPDAPLSLDDARGSQGIGEPIPSRDLAGRVADTPGETASGARAEAVSVRPSEQSPELGSAENPPASRTREGDPSNEPGIAGPGSSKGSMSDASRGEGPLGGEEGANTNPAPGAAPDGGFARARETRKRKDDPDRSIEPRPDVGHAMRSSERDLPGGVHAEPAEAAASTPSRQADGEERVNSMALRHHAHAEAEIPELGKVFIGADSRDGGLEVQVVVETAGALEELRRHGDALASAAAEAGPLRSFSMNTGAGSREGRPSSGGNLPSRGEDASPVGSAEGGHAPRAVTPHRRVRIVL